MGSKDEDKSPWCMAEEIRACIPSHSRQSRSRNSNVANAKATNPIFSFHSKNAATMVVQEPIFCISSQRKGNSMTTSNEPRKRI